MGVVLSKVRVQIMPEKCSKHPEKDALSFCHSCGKYYCSSCLEEGASFYYCYDANCQVAKIRDEGSIPKEPEQTKEEEFLSGKEKRLFFKDSFYYLCIAFPVYLYAFSVIIPDFLHSLGWLLLFSAATCAQIYIVISLLGPFVFRFKAFKKANRKKRCREISIAMLFISVIVLNMNMRKIIGTDIDEILLNMRAGKINTDINEWDPLLLPFLASISAFVLYNIIIAITMKSQRSN
jgi:hypothetical protein